jgi:integrase
MQSRITEGLVRKLLAAPPVKDTAIFDTELRRFAFRVKPGGSALYFARFTAPDGAERRMKVGDPETMTVDEARKEAKRVLGLVDKGQDPLAEHRQRRAAPTVQELMEAYLASDAFAAKTDVVRSNDRARITSHITHRIGTMKAAAVTLDVARRLHRSIVGDTRTNRRGRRLGGSGAARKAMQLLAVIMGWGKSEGLLQALPFDLRELKLGGDGSRDTVITSQAEYARLFDTLDSMVAAGSLRESARAFFLLLASTGLRRGEAQGLRWGQIDLGRRQITLTNTKGARLARGRGKQAVLELVGLPPVAAAALAGILPEGDVNADALVFPPVRGARLSVTRDWQAVRKAAGLPDGLVLHGLRHSVGTVGAIVGMSMPELQALLRHKQPGTTARYLHFAKVSGGLADKAMGGVLPSPEGEGGAVVPLPARRRIG